MCRTAIDNGLTHRVDVFGFTKPDILEYLPVGGFVPEARGWSDLVSEWKRSPSGADGFKEWLRKTKGARINAQTIRTAASEMDHVPEDFQKLLAQVSAAGRTRSKAPSIEGHA